MEEENKEYLENIKNNLTIEQIEGLVAELGGEPQRNNKILKAKTICHCGDTHKLYYYDNTKLFKCYTACNESFDIFDLVFKVKKFSNDKYTFPQSINFISNYFGFLPQQNDFNTQIETLEDWKIFKKYDIINTIKDKEQIVEIKKYDDRILKFLPHPHINIWKNEGISREIMEDRGICYDPVNQGIIIPHYDIDNNLIGIRERTLIKENEQFGKYKPAILNNQMYNHPLGFNLYNINNSHKNIETIKKVIIFERRKKFSFICKLFWKRK